MDALYHDNPRQYLYLARVVLKGGEAYLNPTYLAKGLGAHAGIVKYEIDRLIAAKQLERIEDGKDHHYRIPAFETATFKPTKTVAAVKTLTPADFEPAKLSQDTFDILELYTRRVKRIHDDMNAVGALIEKILQSGWTRERIVAAMKQYVAESDPNFRRGAMRFFEFLDTPTGGITFWGAQYEPREAPSAVAVSADILQMRELMGGGKS